MPIAMCIFGCEPEVEKRKVVYQLVNRALFLLADFGKRTHEPALLKFFQPTSQRTVIGDFGGLRKFLAGHARLLFA